MGGYVTGATPLTPESLLAILQEGSPSPALICPDDDTVVSHGGLASAVHQLAGQRGDHGAVSPVRLRTGDLTAQDRDLMPQHQNLRVLRGVAPREQRQPAEQPDHEQIDEAKEHERRG